MTRHRHYSQVVNKEIIKIYVVIGCHTCILIFKVSQVHMVQNTTSISFHTFFEVQLKVTT